MSGGGITYSKQHCSFCNKTITRNGLGAASHFRKHVREGIAFEINWRHFEYRGVLEFVGLRRYAKIGTTPATIIFKTYYKIKKGRKVEFRHENDNEWIRGIVDDVNENCVFISLT